VASSASSRPVIPACAPSTSVPSCFSIIRTDMPITPASSNTVTRAASAFDANVSRMS
jgi:hypothetical protein